jgi:hypothetical protein
MMLIFTPLHGSHYLVDVIAGVALALAIPASQWLMRTTAGPSAREAIVSRLVPSPELK